MIKLMTSSALKAYLRIPYFFKIGNNLKFYLDFFHCFIEPLVTPIHEKSKDKLIKNKLINDHISIVNRHLPPSGLSAAGKCTFI